MGLETTRFFSRAQIRNWAVIGLLSLGLLAQTLYLWTLVQAELGDRIIPFARWYDWCLMGGWVIAALCLAIAVRRPQTAIALFLLPPVLILIGVATALADSPPFSQDEAIGIWGMVHGLALLLGTVTVALGFAAGMMYLYQSHRLKHKLPPSKGLKLPSLEWMERMNRSALFVSTGLLAVGLGAGFVVNLIASTVAWTSPLVISSAVLFLWLVATLAFEILYKPARQGRKMAYLTVASFVFLALVMTFALMGRHASPKSDEQTGRDEAVEVRA